jgi:hypothetical protein
MKQFPYISLHPKLAALLEVVLGFVWLTFLPHIDAWWKVAEKMLKKWQKNTQLQF